MRVSKTNKLVTRPVNKLYSVERFSSEDIDLNANKPRENLSGNTVHIRRILLRHSFPFSGSV